MKAHHTKTNSFWRSIVPNYVEVIKKVSPTIIDQFSAVHPAADPSLEFLLKKELSSHQSFSGPTPTSWWSFHQTGTCDRDIAPSK